MKISSIEDVKNIKEDILVNHIVGLLFEYLHFGNAGISNDYLYLLFSDR